MEQNKSKYLDVLLSSQLNQTSETLNSEITAAKQTTWAKLHRPPTLQIKHWLTGLLALGLLSVAIITPIVLLKPTNSTLDQELDVLIAEIGELTPETFEADDVLDL